MDDYSVNTNKSSAMKKWLPIGGLTLLTLALMIYFKNYHIDTFSVLDKGKSILERVYTKNLEPLFFENELDNEDIFNFAMYDNLPVDRENNKVIKFDEDSEGNEVFELTEIPVKDNTRNYEKFLRTFIVSQEEKNAFDSILNKYRHEIYSSILVNENNAIAVDSRLPLIHQAIKADITSMLKATKINRELNLIESSDEMRNDFSKVVAENLGASDRELIFLTPDTVFAKNVSYEKDKVIQAYELLQDSEKASAHEIERPELAFKPRKVEELESDEMEHSIVDYSIANSEVKVKFGTPEIDIPRYQIAQIKNDIEKAAEQLKSFSLSIEADSLAKLRFSIGVGSGENYADENIDFEFNLMQNIGEIISESLEAAGSFDETDWEEFGIKMDSLANTWELETERETEKKAEPSKKKKKIRRKKK